MNLIKKDVIISPGPRLLEFRVPLLDQHIRRHLDEIRSEAVRAYETNLKRTSVAEGNR